MFPSDYSVHLLSNKSHFVLLTASLITRPHEVVIGPRCPLIIVSRLTLGQVCQPGRIPVIRLGSARTDPGSIFASSLATQQLPSVCGNLRKGTKWPLSFAVVTAVRECLGASQLMTTQLLSMMAIESVTRRGQQSLSRATKVRVWLSVVLETKWMCNRLTKHFGEEESSQYCTSFGLSQFSVSFNGFLGSL